MKLISIIVPVYNVEKYLSECIDSLLRQTYKNIEIILVDDGSTDSSGDICDSYGKTYKNITVIHKSNEGLGFARNSGLEQVKGEYVAFVDSDDFLDSDFFETLYFFIKKYKCDACKSSFKKVYNGKILYEHRIESELYIGDSILYKFLPRVIGSDVSKKDSIPMSAGATLYSMQIIEIHHLRFPSERKYISEDLLFNIEYYSYADKVYMTDYIGYNYRFNPNSLSSTYRPDRFQKSIDLYRKEVDILKRKKIYKNCKYRCMRYLFICIHSCFQQLNLKTCNLSVKEKKQVIYHICRCKEIQDILKEYPINKTGIKQRIFLYMLKFRAKNILYLYYCILHVRSEKE